MRGVVYDASVLIAADRSERRAWAAHRVRLEAGVVPLVPAPVVAQVSRSPKQAQIRRFLRGCETVPFDEAAAHRVGLLLGRAGRKDVVDGSVVELAVRSDADILTRDAEDLGRLVTVAGARIGLLRS